MKPRTRQGISRFLTLYSLLCAAAILTVTMASIYLQHSAHSRSVALLQTTRTECLQEKAEAIFATCDQKDSTLFMAELMNRKDVAGVLLVQRTLDENTVHVINARSSSLKLPVPGENIAAPGGRDNCARGFAAPFASPDQFTMNNTQLHILYIPLRDKTYGPLLCIFIKAEDYSSRISRLAAGHQRTILLIILAGIAGALATALTALMFNRNLTRLLHMLSTLTIRAAEGRHGLSLDPEMDAELTEIALSLNSLLHEISEKDRQIATLASKELTTDRLFSTGVDLLKTGRLEDARSVFETLALLSPDSFGAHFNLGVIYARQRDLTRARESFELALSRNPGHNRTEEYLQKIDRMMQQDEQSRIVT